jgi:hypothetical protein
MSESASSRVVVAVAEATGTDPAELPPLYEVIDPDALDAVFGAGVDGTGGDRQWEDDRELRFSYAGREVSVRSDEVTVGPARESHRRQFEE